MTTENTNPEPVADPVDEADGPKQLREALKHEKAKNRQLTTKLMDRAYQEAKLDPTTGLGKAIAKEYDGDPDAESLLAFAKEEYGYEPTADDPNPEATQRREQQAVVDNVEAQTVPSTNVPLTDSEALREASASGDLVTAGNIKAAKLRKLMTP